MKKLVLAVVVILAVAVVYMFLLLRPGEVAVTQRPESPDDRVTTLSVGHANVYFIQTDDGHILVDTGMPGNEESVASIFTAAEIEPEAVKLIIATHAHLDHVGSLALAKEMTGANVLCHENAAPLLSSGTSSPVIAHDLIGRLIGAITSSSYPSVDANVVIRDEFDLGAYGVEGKVIHTPGHTDESVTVVLDNGEMLIGDLVRGSAEDIQIGSFYEDEDELMETLNELAALQPRTVYMSHGDAVDGETFAHAIDDL